LLPVPVLAGKNFGANVAGPEIFLHEPVLPGIFFAGATDAISRLQVVGRGRAVLRPGQINTENIFSPAHVPEKNPARL
jgi:hypothetical protein